MYSTNLERFSKVGWTGHNPFHPGRLKIPVPTVNRRGCCDSRGRDGGWRQRIMG
jgi:hypothetical protein